MPQDPEKNPMLDEFEASVPGNPLEKIAPRTDLKAAPDFLESLRIPGAIPGHTGSNIAKILANVVAGAPGGRPGMAMNLAQGALMPSSLPPVVGAGNATEALTGLLPGWLKMIPGVKQAAKAAPKTIQGLFGALSGSANSAATAYDRGGDVGTAAKVGAAIGGPLGVAGGKLQEMGNQLPSPTAQKIDTQLGDFTNAPRNAFQRGRQANSLLSTLAEASSHRNSADTSGLLGQEQQILMDFMRNRAKAPGKLHSSVPQAAGDAAEMAAAKHAVDQKIANARFLEIFDAAGMDPKKLTAEANSYMAKLEPSRRSLTLQQAVETAVNDPSYATGLRHLLEQKDPKMLNSVRAEFLMSVFESQRTGKGGKGAYPQIYAGKQLAENVDKLNSAAINALFDNPNAHKTLREIAESAHKAEELAKLHKVAGGIGALSMSAAGYATMHSMGRTVTDPMSAGALVLAAGAGYFALNVPRFIEANIQTDGAIGQLLTQYLKSKNPEKLPTAVQAALSKIGMAVKYPANKGVKKETPSLNVY